MAGCTVKKGTPQERAAAAKTLFERATKDFHNPSAEAKGAEQLRLQNEAALCYQRLLKEFPDQAGWCAPSLCGLAGLRAAQTNLDESVRLYARVGAALIAAHDGAEAWNTDQASAVIAAALRQDMAVARAVLARLISDRLTDIYLKTSRGAKPEQIDRAKAVAVCHDIAGQILSEEPSSPSWRAGSRSMSASGCARARAPTARSTATGWPG